MHRGVIAEKNIISDDETHVTFRYRDSKTGAWKNRKVKGEFFIWLVFQHALPTGFRRVRDYGYLHGNAKTMLQRIQAMLNVLIPKLEKTLRPGYICKHCGKLMSILGFIRPSWRNG